MSSYESRVEIFAPPAVDQSSLHAAKVFFPRGYTAHLWVSHDERLVSLWVIALLWYGAVLLPQWEASVCSSNGKLTSGNIGTGPDDVFLTTYCCPDSHICDDAKGATFWVSTVRHLVTNSQFLIRAWMCPANQFRTLAMHSTDTCFVLLVLVFSSTNVTFLRKKRLFLKFSIILTLLRAMRILARYLKCSLGTTSRYHCIHAASNLCTARGHLPQFSETTLCNFFSPEEKLVVFVSIKWYDEGSNSGICILLLDQHKRKQCSRRCSKSSICQLIQR